VLNRIDLSFRQRIAILIGLLLLGLAALLFVDPIPQDPDYHRLADTRAFFFGIPNFNDVMSNAGFALVGVLGLIAVAGVSRHVLFVKPVDARPYLIYFAGVALVSLGSAWYLCAVLPGRPVARGPVAVSWTPLYGRSLRGLGTCMVWTVKGTGTL
jgi:hypothetical protein